MARLDVAVAGQWWKTSGSKILLKKAVDTVKMVMYNDV